MRFVIKQAGCGSERLGTLTGFVKSPGTVIETPTAALLTQGGSVTHMTAEVLTKVFTTPQLLWVPLSNSYQLEAGLKAQGQGLAKFAGLAEHITCITAHAATEINPPGHFELDKVPLWTKNGKKIITADRYMDLMEVYKPDIILAIADGRTSLSEGPKRIWKSVDRTCSLLDKCVDRYKGYKELQNSALIGVVVAPGVQKKCEECIQHILKYKESLSGIALAGLTDGTDESYTVANEKLEEIFKNVDDVLPKDLLRIIEGGWNPAIILSAIEHGFDIFDGSYPLKLTNAGFALSLNLDVNELSSELCILDLTDERYKEDFIPILSGCECLTCKKHTRAYIRHLLNTREMLSSVLLSIICPRISPHISNSMYSDLRKYMDNLNKKWRAHLIYAIRHSHNLHHFDQLFRHARRHIAANTFQIYKQHITKQYEVYLLSQTKHSTNEPKDDILKDGAVKSNKKLKVDKKENISNSKVANGF